MRIHHHPMALSPGKHLKRIAVACSLLCFSLAASSMDLLQAYEAASKNDASILAARAAAMADREGLAQAKSQFFPYVSASASRTKNRLTTTTPNFLGTEQTTQSEYPSESQSLTLKQPLYRPQLMAQYRQAQAFTADAEAVLQQEEQGLAVRVASAYFDALMAHEQLALVLAQQTAYTTQLDVARKLFAAGTGTRTDVDESLARLDMNRAVELETRQNVAYTLHQLQSFVNEPVGELARLNVERLELEQVQSQSLDSWTERAMRNSPLIQSLSARVDVAREEARKVGSGHYPTLDAVLQWSNNKSESVTNNRSQYTNNSAALQLNIPIFAGGYVNSQVRQALTRQERAEQQLEAGRRDLEIRVHKEFRGVTEGVPRIKALEQALRSSNQLVLSSKKSFEAGSRTVMDILNAEQQRVMVMRDLAQARYQYLISKIRLLSLVGEADIVAVTAMNRAFQP